MKTVDKGTHVGCLERKAKNAVELTEKNKQTGRMETKKAQNSKPLWIRVGVNWEGNLRALPSWKRVVVAKRRGYRIPNRRKETLVPARKTKGRLAVTGQVRQCRNVRGGKQNLRPGINVG